MGWSLGHDSRWGKYGRDIGYGVPAICDHPGCNATIDRGLSYVCGTHPYGGDHGCGLHFCGEHLSFEERGDEFPQLCERCVAEEMPFEPKPDVAAWVEWKLSDESWAQWRTENPEEVVAMRHLLQSSEAPTPMIDRAEGERSASLPPAELNTNLPHESKSPDHG